MDTHLELHALPHPDPRVGRVGFDLTHPYVEHCWSSVIGPSGIAILRRLPVLWLQHEPARLPTDELARSLGLGPGAGQHSRLHRSLDRLVQFRLGVWIDQGRTLGVYSEVPPMRSHQLERTPEWTRAAHERLLGEHLDRIATDADHGPKVTEITSRLDRLQRPIPREFQPTNALAR